jgi:hypothetical protein
MDMALRARRLRASRGAARLRVAPTSEDVVAIGDGARVIPLPRLMELKLVSGTSAPGSRRKDLADVYALIAANRLPREYAYEVDCSVREAYCKSRTTGRRAASLVWTHEERRQSARAGSARA